MLQKVLIIFPSFDDFTRNVACKFECAADQYVVSKQKTDRHLKRAMKLFVTNNIHNTPLQVLAQFPQFAFDHLQQRLHTLQGKPFSLRFSKIKLLISFGSVVALLVITMGNSLMTKYVAAQTLTYPQPFASTTDCNLMSCATECLHTRNSTRQQSSTNASLNKQMSLKLTE